MQLFDYGAASAPMHSVFLELDRNHHHLDFKFLDENNNVIIPSTFYIQLSNKDVIA